MQEVWCVIESDWDGSIFEPDFFNSKEEAAAFIEADTKECLGNMTDLPDARRRTGFENDEPVGRVYADKYSWFWHGFNVTNKIEKLKENNNG